MDGDQDDISSIPPNVGDDESRSAVNSLILDYYKKFGRKRDLEQYFSLSTAQSDIRDPSSVFWARMKVENESSDSGERSDKKSESSQELCRISIRFPAQEPCTSQDEDSKTKTESVSPPIIIEELPHDSIQNSEDEAMKSDDEAIKSDDNNSQKSYDVNLDTSLNKLHSPSSSITSQRRLEWDSLADVGYANESDRKTSASSLSTLERLALKQQFSINDSQQNSNLGAPTAHSTPVDDNEAKSKTKKGVGKKSTKIYKKDIDLVEVNVPHSSNMNPGQSINVNLTKHISFNVEKDGKVTIDNIQKDISVSPEKITTEAEVSPKIRIDRDVQTSLTKAISAPSNTTENIPPQQKIPILISLNTLRSRVRRRRLRMARRKLKTKKRADKEKVPVQEKNGEQLSEAESFEYMPGHIYHQNQLTANDRPSNPVDNKSSLESSGVLTSDSSKDSKHSFTKDLEKSIDLLKSALQKRGDDSSIKKQLIQQVCRRLMSSQYRDDDSTTDFLSGLSFSSKKLGLSGGNNTTTSTSDAKSSAEKSRPKKSILRKDKFNPGSIASTSQSVPNLPIASNSERLVRSNLTKNLTASNTESDVSSKEKTSSDNRVNKTSSEELYKKYLQALKREEAYKKHLRDKEMFLKQKLVCSDSAFKVPVRAEVKPNPPNNRLKDLIIDLTRNNYDDGSGDASKLEGGSSSHINLDRYLANRNQRSHSVFTLSSGNTDAQNKKNNLKKKIHCDTKDLSKPGPSKDSHYCCCPHHGNLKFADSSVQVNIKNPCNEETCPARRKKTEKHASESPRKLAKIIADDATGNLEYVCLCSKNAIQEAPDDFLIYKCSRLPNKGMQLHETSSNVQCNNKTCPSKNIDGFPSDTQYAINKSSQTDMLIKMTHDQSPNNLICAGDQKRTQKEDHKNKPSDVLPLKNAISIYESTRWIQTEISINPKITEPTLSDINIVSDTNCAKLISENCRVISKPSLTDIFSTQAVASSATALSSSTKSTGSLKNIGMKFKDYDSSTKSMYSNSTSPEANIEHIEHSEKITIPIHGTNMTLMVSLGSERTLGPNRKTKEIGTEHSKDIATESTKEIVTLNTKDIVNVNTKEMITECIGTEKISSAEQATSVIDECSIGVQADNPDVIETTDVNSNNIGNDNLNIDRVISASQKPLVVNTCLTAKDVQYGTYPKKSPVNDQKPLRRANTDTDKVLTTGFSKNIAVGKDFTQSKNNSTKATKTVSRTTSPDKRSEMNRKQSDYCSCGCKGKKENCRLDCIEGKRIPNRKLSLDKEMSTQVDSKLPNRDNAPDHKSDRCSCGCGGAKYSCKKDCAMTSAGSTICHKQTSDGQESSPVTSNTQSDKCFCGCKGSKNMCIKICKEEECGTQSLEQTSTRTNDCGTQPIEQTSTQTNNSLKPKDTCTCGCGGTKNKCKRSCPEISPRDEDSGNKKQLIDTRQSYDRVNTQSAAAQTRQDLCGKSPLDKEVDTQTNLSLAGIKKCPCGCGGSKDKCKRTCKEHKSSPRNEKGENKMHCNVQMSDKQINTQTDISPRQGDQQKIQLLGKHMDTQTDATDTESNMCGYPSDKEINTQTDTYLTKYEICPCGCGGSKNKCRKSCKELISSTRYEDVENPKQCRKQATDKKIDTQTDIILSQIEKCSCGCGGSKDNCQHDCVELKLTQREQYNRQNMSIYTMQGVSQSYKEQGSSPRELINQRTDAETQKTHEDSPPTSSRFLKLEEPKYITRNTKVQSSGNGKHYDKALKIVDSSDQTDGKSSDKGQKFTSETEPTDSNGSDPIIDLIQNITKKYTKKNVEKNKRKKCFKEIMTVLNYLLETDELNDGKEDLKNRCESASTADETDASVKMQQEKQTPEKISKKVVDKGIQLSSKKSKVNPCATESSEVLTSTDIPGTSSDSATCRVLNKIKKECERYHQKRCKVHSGKNCEGTSTTSMNCDQCRRVHHCQCRSHKCKNHKKSSEKISKGPIAYNLILQTSESMMSDGPSGCEKSRQLKNIIVKVPKKKPPECMPFREIAAKFERQMPCTMHCSVQKDVRSCRSRSLPNESEISSMEEIIRKSQGATVREYLEKNRPDFIAKCAQRQTCMKYISESRANERAIKRDVLSMHLAQLPDVTELDASELRRLASELGRRMRQKQPASKFISEREMKKHSEKIYKSLPEVVRKKEEQKKENYKKTNLLMASIFKRNLQKKTLRGSVNLSNYSNVIKI